MKKSILSVILSLFCIVPLFAEEGIVQAASLNVRIRPGIKKPDTAVASIKKDEKVNIVNRDSGWLEISLPEGSAVWVYGTSLKDDMVVKEARLRSGPGLAYTAYKQTAKPGTKIEVIQKTNDNWIKIKTIPGMTAWVSEEFIKLSSNPSSNVQAILDRKEPTTTDANFAPQTPAKDERVKDEPPISDDAKKNTGKPEKDLAQEKQEKNIKDSGKGKTEKVEPPSKDKDTKDKDTAPVKPPAKKKLTDAEIQKELKKLPFVKDSEKKVSLEGFLVSVNSENLAITHALAAKTEKGFTPICYVHSLKFDLTQWENQKVKMEGTEKKVRGWQNPLVDAEKVTSLW